MLRVTEFNSLAAFQDLRAVWDELLALTRGGTFFHSLDWLQTFWQFYGEGNQLRILLVEDGDGTLGILPLLVMREPTRIGHIRVLGFPLNGWGSFYGPIGPNPAETLQTGLQHIHDTPRNWDVLDVRWIDANEAQRCNVPSAMEGTGFHFESQVWHTSAQIQIDDGWESYWRSRKSPWRNNVRRSEKLLARQGEIKHVRYRPAGAALGDGNPRWDLYDMCVELAERSWQGSSTTGTTLSHRTVREYLRAVHESAAHAGAVDLNLLLINEKPVAFAYNYCWNGWVYGLRSGFAATEAHAGAGTVLMAKMIEDSCRRGDRLIDLGPNYLQNKRYWLTRLQPALHYTVFNPVRLRAQAMRLKRIAKRWLGWTNCPAQSTVVEIKETTSGADKFDSASR